MPDRTNKVPRPGVNPNAKKRETPVIKAFQQSDYDIIYPEGETIDIDPDIQVGYIVRQGSVTVEMVIATLGGFMTIALDTVEAGEYFNIHSLFGFKLEDGTDLRYRAQCRTVIMHVNLKMFPQDPQKLFVLLKSFMQTSARREGKLRQLTGYALQRAEEKRVDRGNSNSEQLNRYRPEIEKRDKRIAELQRALASFGDIKSQIQKLSVQVTELENANAALRRDKLSLSSDIRKLQDELKRTKGELAIERRTRLALEKRNTELTQQLAKQESAVTSVRFPSANSLLESSELNDLEASAKQFRQAAEYFEGLSKGLATMMQRAIELLAEDNPGMIIKEDVMMLMTGEEPPPRQSVEEARARRNSVEFKTMHLGSEDPNEAHSRGKPKHKQTDRNIIPRKPEESTSSESDGDSPESQPAFSEGPLSQKDLNAIREEFDVDSIPLADHTDASQSHTGINAPYPKGLNDTWDSEPDPESRNTRPFIPENSQVPTNSDIDIPGAPPTPRLSEPSLSSKEDQSTNLSSRYQFSTDELSDSFRAQEVGSDSTPVVHEFPQSHQKTSTSRRSDGWDGDTYSSHSTETDQNGIPTRREESNLNFPAVNFLDEAGTDVREIQEDWQRKLHGSSQLAEAANAPPLSLRDLVDEEETDPLELSDEVDCDGDELIQVTEIYKSPGQAVCEPVSTEDIKPDSDDIRKTRAYGFTAPGKPPKPGS